MTEDTMQEKDFQESHKILHKELREIKNSGIYGGTFLFFIGIIMISGGIYTRVIVVATIGGFLTGMGLGYLLFGLSARITINKDTVEITAQHLKSRQ